MHAKKNTLEKDKSKSIETNDEQDKTYSKTSISAKVGIDLEAERWPESEEEESSG